MIGFIPPRIHQIHRIVEAVGIPVRPTPGLGHLKPVRLQEQAGFGVVIAGVQVLEAGVVVQLARRWTLRLPVF